LPLFGEKKNKAMKTFYSVLNWSALWKGTELLPWIFFRLQLCVLWFRLGYFSLLGSLKWHGDNTSWPKYTKDFIKYMAEKDIRLL